MKLWPATIEPREPGFVAGFVCQVPSGRMLQVAWHTDRSIEPSLDAAKQYAASLLDQLLKARMLDDVERTNWPSVVAAIQRVITDFNDKVRAPAVVQ